MLLMSKCEKCGMEVEGDAKDHKCDSKKCENCGDSEGKCSC